MRKKYDHEIWKKYLSDGVQGGHGGIDWLVMNDFVDSLIESARARLMVMIWQAGCG